MEADSLHWHDAVALGIFVVVWAMFSHAASGRFVSRMSLTKLMNLQREKWMRTMAQRELRMIDTGIETRISTGDFFEIPPGHDAYVEGADRVELILFAPPEHQH